MTKLMGAAATVAMLLVLAACGGGDSSNTNSAGKTESSSPSATASDTSSGSGTGAWTTSECAELATSMALAAGGVGPQAGASDLGSVSDFLRAAADGAPSDLRADLITLADGLQKFYDTLQAAGIDFSDPSTYSSQKAAETLSKAADQLEKDVGKAPERIQQRMTELCGSN